MLLNMRLLSAFCLHAYAFSSPKDRFFGHARRLERLPKRRRKEKIEIKQLNFECLFSILLLIDLLIEKMILTHLRKFPLVEL